MTIKLVTHIGALLAVTACLGGAPAARPAPLGTLQSKNDFSC